MIIIGLTGSIAMGKSTVADLFVEQGVPTISADQIVHQLYQGAAIPLIEATFPGTTTKQEVNRNALMQTLAKDPSAFKKLNEIIHPLVRRAEWEFITQQKNQGAESVILEIPLLFETKAETAMDAVILVSASPETQKQRALARPAVTEEKLDTLLARQMPDKEKRLKADYIINTDKTIAETADDVAICIEKIKNTTKASAYKIWEKQYA